MPKSTTHKKPPSNALEAIAGLLNRKVTAQDGTVEWHLPVAWCDRGFWLDETRGERCMVRCRLIRAFVAERRGSVSDTVAYEAVPLPLDGATERKVHPAAAVFPMLPDDELADLAEDIKANGLLHPITVDKDGAIVDGRNRDAACKLAGVEPRYQTLPEGADVRAYILRENVKRRHMKAGAIAVAVALMYVAEAGDEDESSKSGRLMPYGARVEASKTHGIPATRFSEAALVVRYAPDLAEKVLSGGYALDKAYREARERKDAASSMEAQMGVLRAEAPDLADLVVEERISLRGALDELDRRRAEDRKRRQAATTLMVTVLNFLAPATGAVEDHATAWLAKYDPSFVPEGQEVSMERIDAAVTFLGAVRAHLTDSDREARRGGEEAQPAA